MLIIRLLLLFSIALFSMEFDLIIAKFFSNKFPQAEDTNILYAYFDKESIYVFFNFITNFGTYYLEVGVIGIFLFFIYKNRDKKHLYLKYILGVFSSFVISGILVNILKMVFTRARPYMYFDPSSFYNAFAPNSIELLFNNSYLSFPSGHVITVWTTIWFLSLNLKNNKIKISLFVLGFFVALSRIYLSVHWFSDVVISIILSFYIAKFVQFLVFRNKKYENRTSI